MDTDNFMPGLESNIPSELPVRLTTEELIAIKNSPDALGDVRDPELMQKAKEHAAFAAARLIEMATN